MTPPRVLIVEDDAIFAMYLKDILEQRGYFVLEPVSKGEEALEIVKQQSPFLILMDIELAGKMDGIITAQQISEKIDLPIIFLTSYSQKSLIQNAKTAAPYGYLIKPVTERELFTTIEMALHRHQIDLKVKQSEARYRNLVEQATDGILVLDPCGFFLEANNSFCEMLGYNRNEIQNLNIQQIIPLGYQDEISLYTQKILNNETLRFENTLLKKDGAQIDVEISGKMLEDGNFQGIVRDITERKKMQKSLFLQSTALHAAANAIVITDINGNIQWANPAFSKMTGYDLSEAVGKNPRELVKSGKHSSAFYQNIWETILSGAVWQGEIINRRKDGTFYVEEMTLTPVFDNSKKITQFIAIKQDISRRKEAESARRQSEEKFTKFFEFAPDALAISRTEDGKYLEVNRGFEDYLGFERDEVIGKTSLELNIWQNDEYREILKNEVVKKGEIHNHEMVLIKKNGDLSTCLMSAKLIQFNGEIFLLSMARDITNRKKSQIALQESEKRFKALFDHAGDAILLMDDQANYVDANAAACKILGYEKEELLRKSIFELIPVNLLPENRSQAWERFIKTGFQDGDYQMKTKAGSSIDINYRAVANIIPGIHLSILHDITNEKAAQEEIIKARDFYLTLLEQFPALIWRANIKGKFDYFNQTWLNFRGASLEDEIDMGWLKGIHPQDHPVFLKKYRQAFEEKNTFTMDLRILNADGQYRWITNYGQPIQNQQGVNLGFLGVCFDITEKLNIQDQLYISHDYLKAILENLPLAFSVVDAEGNLRQVNRAWEKLVNVSRETLLDQRIFENPNPDHFSSVQLPEIMEKIEQVFLTKQPQKFEMEVNFTGRKLWLSSISFLVPLENYGEYGVGSIIMDITSERQIQKELYSSIADLEALYRSSHSIINLQEEKKLLSSISRCAVENFEGVQAAWVETSQNGGIIRRVSAIYEKHGGQTKSEELDHPLLLLQKRLRYYPKGESAQRGGPDDKKFINLLKEIDPQSRVQSLGCFRLQHGQDHLGWIFIASQQPDFFLLGRNNKIFESFANQAATSLSNVVLYQSSQQQIKVMETMYQIGQRLNKLTSASGLPDEIMNALGKIIDFDICTVLLRDRLSDQLNLFAIRVHENAGISEPAYRQRLEKGFLKIGKGTVGWVLEQGKPVSFSNVHNDPHYHEINPHTRSLICVPLLAGERAFGVIKVETAFRDSYSDQDFNLLQTFASQISTAIQNVQLIQSLKERQAQLKELNTRLSEVEEAERKRLANELHDQVGQNLSAINLSLNLIRSQLPPKEIGKLGEHVDDTLGLLEETIQSIRSIMTELRPSILDDYGLSSALRWLGEQFAWRTGLDFKLEDQTKNIKLSPTQETALFRISQEALSNIAKHAGAESVKITLKDTSTLFCLTIEDDGVGYFPSKTPNSSSGWGINIMTERAEAVGGKLRLENLNPKGTSVMIELPEGEEKDED